MNKLFIGGSLLLLLLATPACLSSDDDGPVLPPPPAATIDFGGFVLTDANGAPISGVDSNDWRLDVVFNQNEKVLYSPNLRPLCSETGGTAIAPAFPNPFSETLNLQIDNPNGAAMSIVVVDRNYEPQLLFNPLVLSEEDSVVQFQLDMRALPAALDTMRLYYVLAKDNCTLRGYGDLLRQ